MKFNVVGLFTEFTSYLVPLCWELITLSFNIFPCSSTYLTDTVLVFWIIFKIDLFVFSPAFISLSTSIFSVKVYDFDTFWLAWIFNLILKLLLEVSALGTSTVNVLVLALYVPCNVDFTELSPFNIDTLLFTKEIPSGIVIETVAFVKFPNNSGLIVPVKSYLIGILGYNSLEVVFVSQLSLFLENSLLILEAKDNLTSTAIVLVSPLAKGLSFHPIWIPESTVFDNNNVFGVIISGGSFLPFVSIPLNLL